VVFQAEVCGPIPAFVGMVRELFDGTVTEFISRNGINGYTGTVVSPVGKVSVAWGGNGNTVFLNVPGDACARVRCFRTLREFIAYHHGWLTRVDLAFDDLAGDHPIEQAVAFYRAGEFIAGGRPPRISCMGNWIEPDEYGRTLYIGKRKNGKQLVVYEKGKQLGDGASPWVRWEVRFANVDRVLPLEMLTRPRDYLQAAYPALEFVGEARGGRIRVRKAQERISVAELTRYASEAYGGLVAFLVGQGAIADQVVESLRRDAVPRRLSAPTAEERARLGNDLVAECTS
jgi:phage replication initiation protein